MFMITDHTSRSSKKTKLEKTIFNNIDDCINSNFTYESMRSRLASHHTNNSKNNPNTNVDLVPITFGNIIRAKVCFLYLIIGRENGCGPVLASMMTVPDRINIILILLHFILFKLIYFHFLYFYLIGHN